MGRLGLAWKILTSGELAERVLRLLQAEVPPVATERLPAPPVAAAPPLPSPKPSAKPAAVVPPARSDALTLLATLQREGRLIDFLKEPLESYSDAQVGAAVRDIHRDCGAVLERQFAIRPVLDQVEGSDVAIEGQPDPGKYKLSGDPAAAAHSAGRLVHHGWRATICQLPQWTGSTESASILAPAEVELRKN